MRRLLLAALAFFVFASTASAYVTDPRINALASYVAERQVTVRYLSPDEQAADEVFPYYHPVCYVLYVAWPGGKAFFFNWSACADQYLTGALDVLYGTPGRSSSIADEGLALLAIIHESYHMHGNNDGRCNVNEGCYSPIESKTECQAIIHFRGILEHFGIYGKLEDDLYAAALAHHRELVTKHPAYYDPTCPVQ